MIVSSMALIEIHNALFKDMATFTNKILSCHKEFRRRVLKASRYPFSYSYECYSRLSKNRFIFTFIAMKRGDNRNPAVGIRCLYNRAEGVYVAVVSVENGTTIIYPPHFFRRYRERIVKDFSASSEEIMKRYFSGTWGFSFAILNKEIETLQDGLENEVRDDPDRFVCATSAGYCFGERYGNIYLMKTIVSEEMLFESQKEPLGNLRKDFVKISKEIYGNIDF